MNTNLNPTMKAILTSRNTKENPLFATDVYKMGHMEQYAPGTSKVYAYLIARSGKVFEKTVFFGLQYYLKEYLTKRLTPEMGEEFLAYRAMILGPNSPDVEAKIRALCALGYFPIEIKAVPEGTVMPIRNVLMTITNTLQEFYWVVGFLESLIIKVWDSITGASCSYLYRTVVDEAFAETVPEELHFLKDFTVHDFGYRGSKSEEEAAISGAAHLLSFMGSDTVPALPFVVHYYNADPSKPIMLSVPASEHSVACSFTREEEFSYFENMLKLYPSGIVSVVSDTFDVYRVLTEFAMRLKPTILARPAGSKVVFRPDSGNPEHILCGDPEADSDSNEGKGAVRLLDEGFGVTEGSKGYNLLNPAVGLIYGDGMYLDRYKRTLLRMKDAGYAASNLVIGVGGILRNHSRDTMGFAIKATYVEVNGEVREIEKDPVTDHSKKSHKGLLSLSFENGEYVTRDQCTWDEERASLLQPVFRDGEILREYTWDEVRGNVAKSRIAG